MTMSGGLGLIIKLSKLFNFNTINDESAVGNTPDSESALKQRDKTGDKERGTQNLADVFQLRDAHGRRDDQHCGDVSAEAYQAVLDNCFHITD